MAKLSSELSLSRERALVALAERARAQHAAENFSVALRVLPPAVRRDLLHVYDYARFVDDTGDEAPGGPQQRLELLELLAEDVRALPAGHARLAPVAGLAPLVAAGTVPLSPLLDLIEANRLDQVTASYETFTDLLDYCRLSAAPIGRLVLHRAGAATSDNVAQSDSVCAGLQVLEHCQDVGEDARAGRVYLPQSELRAAGVQLEQLGGAVTPPALRPVLARQVARAEELLAVGAPLVARLSGWAKIAVAGYVAGGLATVDALDAAGFDVLGAVIAPTKLRTATHALRLLGGARGGRA